MPRHQKSQARDYDTVVVAVAVAVNYDPPRSEDNFTGTHKPPVNVAIDNPGAIAKAWGDVQFTPAAYRVDKPGPIVKRVVGVA